MVGGRREEVDQHAAPPQVRASLPSTSNHSYIHTYLSMRAKAAEARAAGREGAGEFRRHTHIHILGVLKGCVLRHRGGEQTDQCREACGRSGRHRS